MSTTHVLFSGCYGCDDDAVVHEVEMPSGYYRVWDGALKPGDLYLNCRLAPKEVVWNKVKTPSDKDIRRDADQSSVKWFGCVVRVGNPVHEACPRCLCAPKMLVNKFCRNCCHEVIVEKREKSKR